MAVTLNVTCAPGQTVLAAGWAVIFAGLFTSTIATVELALVQPPLCTTARNWVWTLRFAVVNGLAVDAISVQATPSVDDCHFTIAPTCPLKAILVDVPGQTVAGFAVAVPPAANGLKVNVAAVVGTLLAQTLLKRARYCFPLSAMAAVKVRLEDVAPAISVNVAPPSILTCHCRAGTGAPDAPVVKLTCPGHTV